MSYVSVAKKFIPTAEPSPTQVPKPAPTQPKKVVVKSPFTPQAQAKSDTCDSNTQSNNDWKRVSYHEKKLVLSTRESRLDAGVKLLDHLKGKKLVVCRDWYCTESCPHRDNCHFYHPETTMLSMEPLMDTYLIRQLEAKLNEATEQLTNRNETIANLQEEMLQLDADHDTRIRRINAKHAEELATINKQHKITADDLCEESKRLRIKVIEQHKKLITTDAHNQKLVEENATLKKQYATFIHQDDEIQKLTTTLQAEKLRVNTYSKMLDALKESINTNLKPQLDEYKRTAEKNSTTNIFQELKIAHEREIAEYKAEILGMKKLVDAHEETISNSNKRIGELFEQTNILHRRLSEEKKQLVEMRNEKLNLSRKMKDILTEQLTKTAETTAATINELTDKLTAEQHRNILLSTEIELFKVELNNKARSVEIKKQASNKASNNEPSSQSQEQSQEPSQPQEQKEVKPLDLDGEDYLARMVVSAIYPITKQMSKNQARRAKALMQRQPNNMAVLDSLDNIKVSSFISSGDVYENLVHSHFDEQQVAQQSHSNTQLDEKTITNATQPLTPTSAAHPTWVWIENSNETPYDNAYQHQIESAYQNYLTGKFAAIVVLNRKLANGVLQKYELNFANMTQTNTDTKFSRPIKRVVSGVPNNAPNNAQPKQVPKALPKQVPVFFSTDDKSLTTMSPAEEQFVRSQFLSTMSYAKIKSITKQLNRTTLTQYALTKAMFKKESIKPNEIFGFHGTHATDPTKLTKAGISLLHAGDGYLGKAFYISENSHYVHKSYAHLLPNGDHQMLGVYTLLGNFEIQRLQMQGKGIFTPSDGYHSRTMIADDTTMHGIYNQAQVVCAYLITYSN